MIKVSQKLKLKCYFELNWKLPLTTLCISTQDLPEFFEDNMETWMTNFHGLLTLDNKLLQTDVSLFCLISLVQFIFKQGCAMKCF